jgi:putative ABC transport system permease protein
MTGPAVPGWAGVATSAVLIVLACGVAVRAKLGLARDILTAALRAAAQLLAIAAVLAALFTHGGVPGAAGWIVIMVVIAGQVAGRRARTVPAARIASTAAVAAGTAVTMVTLVALRVIEVRAFVLVPVGGMVTSTAMQATAVTLLRLGEEAEAGRPAIEARLSLGLTAREAFAPHIRRALRTALVPIIDSTKVVGLISLPGAMTGLILAGVDPVTAIRYQIVVMYMLLAAAALAAITAAYLAPAVLFDDADRLRPLRAPAKRTQQRKGDP